MSSGHVNDDVKQYIYVNFIFCENVKIITFKNVLNLGGQKHDLALVVALYLYIRFVSKVIV